MWSSSRRTFLTRAAATAAALSGLTACGFTPLYGEGTPARALQGQVEVPVLPGLFGFALREQLVNRLGTPDSGRYVLNIDGQIVEDERAIRRDRSITRFNLSATAEYSLESLSTGTPVLTGFVRDSTAYSAVASPFATRAAEEDARKRLARSLADQIVLRLAASADSLAP